MKIHFGEREVTSECARVTQYAQDGSVPAMAAESSKTEIAMAAREIDFANNPFVKESGIIAGYDARHELVTGSAAEIVIAALQLQIGIADPAQY